MSSKNTNGWDKEYRNGRLGGDDLPDYAIMNFYSQIPLGMVLDLGGGDGRNALFLADKGYDVQLIECSREEDSKIPGVPHRRISASLQQGFK